MVRERQQLAMTNVSRKQAGLCADVQLALTQLAVLLPLHPPLPSPTLYSNDELDLIMSWSHSTARRVWWVGVSKVLTWKVNQKQKH